MAWKIGCSILAVIILFVALNLFYTVYKITMNAYTVPRSARQLPRTPGEALGPLTLPVNFPNEEGYLVPGWYREGDNGAAIVFLHGLGGTRAQLAHIARRLNGAGFGVLLIDQRGHGQHPQGLTTFGRAESIDAIAAVEWLRDRPEVEPSRIGLYGASMGAATTIITAAGDPELGCAVADSSYADLEDQALHDLNMGESPVHVPPWLRPTIVRLFTLFSSLVIGKWADAPSPIDVVGDVKCPLFLIHGELDMRIDPESFHELSAAARDAGVDLTTWFVRNENHCAYHDSDEFHRRLLVFYRTHLLSPG